jgi:response regulator RpfG family c-di-GMP phosphodiesterase
LSTDDRDAGYALLISDAENGCGDVAATLRSIGWVVVRATADEFFDLPDVAPPHLVVLDGAPTREERRRCQDRLRSHRRLQSVPLLVLGSEDDRTSYALAIAHGASAYLTKPANEDVLVSVARKLVSYQTGGAMLEKRRHPRRALLVPVDLEIWGHRGRASAWLMDASRVGCRVETAEDLASGAALRVWLPVAEATAHLPLTGQAAWARRLETGLSIAGVRFLGNAALLAGFALGIEPVRGQA